MEYVTLRCKFGFGASWAVRERAVELEKVWHPMCLTAAAPSRSMEDHRQRDPNRSRQLKQEHQATHARGKPGLLVLCGSTSKYGKKRNMFLFP